MFGISDDSLYCEEEIDGSPWKDDGGSGFESQEEDARDSVMRSSVVFVENNDEILRIWQDKELSFMPGGNYLRRLQGTDLGGARSKAVGWMLKASGRFNFNPHTVSSAVNCLDRFLARRPDEPLKTWMIGLLSVGCLSIAAKQEEVYVPLLQDLQDEGMDYTFDSKTIQRMELTILSVLEWRLNSATAFAYIDPVLRHLPIAPSSKTSIHARVTELLLQSLPEIQFVEYKPSVVALSSMYCALDELLPTHERFLKTELSNLMPVEEESLQKCYEIMEEAVVDPLCTTPPLSSNSKSPLSPVAITEIADRLGAENSMDISNYINAYIRNCGNSSLSCEATRKRTKPSD